MTATDELRKLLDERGVEYDEITKGNTTLFQFDYCDSCDDYIHTIAITGACISAEGDYLTPEQAIAATLGGGKLSAEQVRESIERNFSKVAVLDDGKPVEWRDDWVCKIGIDYKSIADELSAPLCGGKLTAEQVRECAETVYFEGYSDGSVNRGAHIDETDWQAIADELNATLGGGECEVETTENWLPAERYHRCKNCGAFFAVMNATGDIPPCVCPNCGKAVKR